MEGEQPQYDLKPIILRFLIPKFTQLIILSAVFYSGLIINLKLLNAERSYNFIIISSLSLLIIIELTICYIKKSKPYFFYSDKVMINNNPLFYSTVQNAETKRNIFDKIFNTCTIQLGQKRLEYIPNSYQIQSYVQKLVNNSNENLYIQQ